MNWLQEAFLEPTMVQAVIIISLVSALGLYLGRIKIFGISLGITFVFFAGILAGHLGIVVNKDMLYFAQSFGLILFVYALGLQVGPGFFSSLKKGGVAMNMMGLGVILLGLIMTVGLHWVTGVSLSNMVGLLCGAVTNTPALGAAQQALLQIDPANTKGVTDMALACAVAYPLGVVGVILAIIILRALFADKKQKDLKEQRDTTTYVAEFHVSNPAIYEKSIKDVMKLTDKHFVISRVWRNGKVSIPTSDTLLHEHDHLLIISVKSDVENIKVLFGEQENVDWNKADIDWNAIDSQLISRRIAVTRNRVNGVKLGSLRLRNLYGINITRVNRAGIDLLASPDLRLQIGDRLTIVGEANSVNTVGKSLGDDQAVKQSEPLGCLHWYIAGDAVRSIADHVTRDEYASQIRDRRRPDHRRNPDGRIRPSFPPDNLHDNECQPDASSTGDHYLFSGIGDRFGCTFLRNGFSGRRIALDRAWISADDRAGADRRFHIFAIFQTRLCAQRGYALREHGKPDGTELCQHDCRWRRTLRFLCHRLSAFNVYPRDFSTIGADVIHLIDQALEHLTSTFSPSTKVVAKR